MGEKVYQVLSTRKIPETLIRQAKEHNIFIDEIEFIKTEPVKDAAVKEKIKQYAEEKIIAIFTSKHAADAVFAEINFQPKWKVYCTSGRTKETLLKYVNADAIIDTADNAAELAEKIWSNGEGEAPAHCVFFCGNRRLDVLPNKLLTAQIGLQELVVYETNFAPQKVNLGYNGILFFSPSAVQSFFLVNQISHITLLFSIGKTTKKELQKYTRNKIIVAEKPTVESMMNDVMKLAW